MRVFRRGFYDKTGIQHTAPREPVREMADKPGHWVIVNKPSLNLNNTSICQFSSAIINSHLNHDYNFLWSTAETDSAITISNAGKYWLTVNDTLGCSITDTFFVSIDSFPSKVSLGPDVAMCLEIPCVCFGK